MLISAFTLLFFANIVNHSKGIKPDVKSFFLFSIYIWIILIFTFRGIEVPDTNGYMNSYYSLYGSVKYEFLYSLLCRIANSFGLSFNGFLFFYEIILFSLWFYISKKHFEDVHLAFLVFFPFMGIYNFGIIIRASMGLCLAYAAITYLITNRTLKGYLWYYGIITCSVFFHQAMIVFYILPFFIFKKFNPVVLLSILLISFIIPLLNIQHLITEFLETYLGFFSFNKLFTYTKAHANFNVQGVYSLTMIKYWLMALLFLWLRLKVIEKQEIYNCFLNIYISGVFLISITHFIVAGNRLAYMFFFFEFVLVGILYEYSSLNKGTILIGALALSLLNYINLISAIPSMINY